jgi:hypothetical protein
MAVWMFVIVVDSVPAFELAQLAPVAGIPVAGTADRALPLGQPPQHSVVAAPERSFSPRHKTQRSARPTLANVGRSDRIRIGLASAG